MASKKVFNQDIAKELCNSDEFSEDLIYMSDYGCFYLWSGQFPGKPEGHFVKLTAKQMRRLILDFCDARKYDQNYTTNIVKDIQSIIELYILREMEHEDDRYVAFNDAIINVETFKIEPFDKQKVATTFIPYNVDEIKSDCPVFKKFLSTSLVHEDDVHKTDQDLVVLAQEMFGSFLLNNLKASAAFFLYGRTASNGKSQMQKVIENIFGNDQCSHLSLADLSHQFRPVGLIGKRVNLSGELDEKFGNAKAFKQLVSGDRVTGEYKYGDSFDFTPRTKYIFSTNKIPTFDGFDRGVRRRLVFLPFHRTFDPSDPDIDMNLGEKLAKEIPGIVGWMIEGAKRLVKNNYQFTIPTSSAKVINRFDQEMSSAAMFINEENWVVNNDKDIVYIPRTELYESYKTWSHESNKKPLSRSRFYEDLENIVKGIKVVRMYLNGKQERCFNLVQVSEDLPPDFADEGIEIVEEKDAKLFE
jgi:putative DNA primase/helicase